VFVLDNAKRKEDHGKAVNYLEADVTDPKAVASAAEQAAQGQGLDICVANAGVYHFHDFLSDDAASWESVIRVNLQGVLITFQAAARQMVAQGRGGRLIATASVAGIRGEMGASAYCASKAGVIAVVQSLAIELAPYGILVNAIAPGETDTHPSQDSRTTWSPPNSLSPTLRPFLEKRFFPTGRRGEPDDIAAAIAFLASDDARYITGATLVVDGGQILV